jgi:hypothetical protein
MEQTACHQWWQAVLALSHHLFLSVSAEMLAKIGGIVETLEINLHKAIEFVLADKLRLRRVIDVIRARVGIGPEGERAGFPEFGQESRFQKLPNDACQVVAPFIIGTTLEDTPAERNGLVVKKHDQFFAFRARKHRHDILGHVGGDDFVISAMGAKDKAHYEPLSTSRASAMGFLG